MNLRHRLFPATCAALVALAAQPATAQPGKADTKRAPAAANLMAPVERLVSGQAVRGTLARGDTVLSDGSLADVYTYQGKAGERVVIDYRSPAFDTFLTVSLGGSSFAQDDDGGGGTNSRTELILPVDGTYQILANALRRGMQGAYTLTLTATPPAGTATQDWARVYPGRGRPGERYALIVGIGRYPQPLGADLNGPVADARGMRSLLVDRYGFRPENVITLTDGEATREGILEAARRHLGQAGPSGVAVFYYSGHGTRLEENVAAADEEPDGKDEALLVWGTETAGSPIVDDEIGAISDGLRAGRALFILDACHSGTGMRDANGFSKFVDAAQLAGQLRLPETWLRSGRDLSGDLDPAGSGGARKRILLAASTDAEVSWISRGPLTPGAGPESVFTYYLRRELERAGPNETFAGVNGRVRTATSRYTKATHNATQSPQAEGRHVNERIRRYLGAP